MAQDEQTPVNETREERQVRLHLIPDYPRFTIYIGKNGDLYWTAVAANGEPMADGSEGYKNEGDCRAGIALLQGSAGWPVVNVGKLTKPKKAPKSGAKKAKRK